MALRHYTDEIGRNGIERLGMIAPSPDGRVTKRPFLVVYDYGQGGVWAYVTARSKDEILRRFPELDVFDREPSWMSQAETTRLRRRTLDVDRPSGLLRDLIAARKGSSTGTG